VFLSHNIPYDTLYIVSAAVTLIGTIIILTVKEEMIGKPDFPPIRDVAENRAE